MPTEAPSLAAEILLLEQNAEYITAIEEAIDTNRVSVVPACPDILSFLRREGRYKDAPRPDLILLDLELSKKEDCETLAEIKQDSQFKRIPVVVVAASQTREDVLQAYELHANAYICKPADREEFIKIIRATLHFWLSLARLPRDI
jgi:two-component system, chemotaxis family, response regulator Rcp1